MSDCALCEAKDAQIDRLTAQVDTFALASVKAELREARETIERLNRTRPQAVAVEVCRELAATDPRDQDSLRCLWCGVPLGQGDDPRGDHRQGCAWKQASVVAGLQAKDETKATVRRWSA